MVEAPLLRVEALGVERGGRRVLDGVGFTLARGEVLHVAGRNGAGKSTLLRALAGLLRAERGRIAVSGAEAEAQPCESMHYLGDDDALKPALSVGENLAFWAAMAGGRADAIGAALAVFGIAALCDLPAAYLSAGQRRRAALARLLLAPRPIWLLDEPLNALDAGAQAALAGVMTRHAGTGGAVVAASHVPLGLPARLLDLDRPA